MSSESSVVSTYKVLFTKDSMKKRKAYQDGVFTIKKTIGDTCLFILSDDSGAELKKVSDKYSKYVVKTNGEFSFGIYGVQVEEMVNDLTVATSVVSENTTKKPFLNKNPFVQLKAQKPIATVAHIEQLSGFTNDQSSHNALLSTYKARRVAHINEVSFDPSLMKMLRPHQVEGAEFLLERLTTGLEVGVGSQETDDDTFKGAILADEVT